MLFRSLRSAMLWALLVLLVCLMPGSAVGGYGLFAGMHADKIGHAFLFAVLFVLLAKGLRRQTGHGELQRHAKLAGFAVALMYGGLIELLQEITALGRMAELADMAANTVGMILGMAYLHWGEAWLKRHRQRWEHYF